MGPENQGPEALIGQAIAGYRLDRVLGVGATGAVYFGTLLEDAPKRIERANMPPVVAGRDGDTCADGHRNTYSDSHGDAHTDGDTHADPTTASEPDDSNWLEHHPCDMDLDDLQRVPTRYIHVLVQLQHTVAKFCV